MSHKYGAALPQAHVNAATHWGCEHCGGVTPVGTPLPNAVCPNAPAPPPNSSSSGGSRDGSQLRKRQRVDPGAPSPSSWTWWNPFSWMRTAEHPAKRLELAVDEGTLPQQQPVVSLGTWLDVADFPPLHPSSTHQPPGIIYVRQAVVDVFIAIRNWVLPQCWLQGPPGTGKSQLGRLVAVACALDGMETTFGEVRNSDFYITVLSRVSWRRTECYQDDFVDQLKTAIKKPGGFVVLDGVVDRKEGDPVKSLAYNMLMFRNQGSRTLVISSGQLSLKGTAADLAMPGWTLKELRSAVDNKDFLNTTALKKEVDDGVDVSSVVERKHCLCGGSARLVFGCSTATARGILVGALANVDRLDKKAVLFGHLQSSHDRAENVLMQGFVGSSKSYEPSLMKMAFSSKFVLRQLEEAIDLGDMLDLYKHCCLINPTMQGWAFEELVFKCLSRQKPTTYSIREDKKNADVSIKEWTIDCLGWFTRSNHGKRQVEELELLALDELELHDLHLKCCVLLRPLTEWNFPTLDHILLLRDGTKWTLIALQDSIAKTHRFNADVLFSIHSALKSFMPSPHQLDGEIQLIAVVPKGLFSQFKFQIPSPPALSVETLSTSERQGAGDSVQSDEVSISRRVAYFHDLPE